MTELGILAAIFVSMILAYIVGFAHGKYDNWLVRRHNNRSK